MNVWKEKCTLERILVLKCHKKKILKIPEEMKRSRETGKGRKQHEKQKER